MSLEADREGAATRLRDRLALLRGGLPAPPAPRPAPAPSRQVDLPGGREEATPFGPCYVVERRYPLDYCHGPRPLGALRDVPPALLADLGGVPQLAATPLDRVLWLDTETTGLAGGTGTYVFLVGLGFFTTPEGGAQEFAVRQYFLREPREERALMHALGATLDAFGVLVTFNGKSFDWPLLATRFVLQRLPHGRRAWPHLDLLHPARRVWKHRLPGCSLGALEEHVLGVRREGDVPGFLIPQRYFQYLRDGDPRPLLPVLAHNAADIVSLLALLTHLGHLAARPAEVAPPGADCYGLATLYAALGRPAESIAAYRAALADPVLPPSLRRAARIALALALKRAARWEEACVLWRELIKSEARRRAPDPWAHEELAKYQEHVARDCAAALSTVEAALTLLDLRDVATGRDALLHRQARLRRKLTSSPPP